MKLWQCVGIAAVISLMLSLSGCASTKAYPGPGLPDEEVATVVGFWSEEGPSLVSEFVSIIEVDGETFVSTAAKVLPGEHIFSIEAQMWGNTWAVLATGGPRRERKQVQFVAEAGHEYKIIAKENRSPPPKYHIWVEDLTTRAVVAGNRSNKKTPNYIGNNKSVTNGGKIEVRKQGQYSHLVEKAAEERGCSLDGLGELVGGNNSDERYRVYCTNREAMNFTCEWGNCRNIQE